MGTKFPVHERPWLSGRTQESRGTRKEHDYLFEEYVDSEHNLHLSHLHQRDVLWSLGGLLDPDWGWAKTKSSQSRRGRPATLTQSFQQTNLIGEGWYRPFPMTHKRIRLAQYSLVHHWTSRRRVSRPMEPPSESDSLLFEATEGAGEGIREPTGERSALRWSRVSFWIIPLSFPWAFNSFAALERDSLFPEPNFDQTCPGRLKCLFNWNIRHTSVWWFFWFSEFTALSSRKVHEGVNNGEWKKLEKRSSAPVSSEVATLK